MRTQVSIHMKRIPSLIFSFSFFLLLSVSFLISCQQEQNTTFPEEAARQDSLALHVGVMPVMDCLPIYYAQQTDLFNEQGVDVRLRDYLSQMDADTALQRGWVEIAYTDVIRSLQMKEDVRVVMGLPCKHSLVTARSKRIRQLKHLNERMVALDRLSMSDYWSDEAMLKGGLEQTSIYRPQINDIQLRLSMLSEQLVDAALLPEPYATQAIMKGNRCIFTSNDSSLTLACMTIRKNVLTDTMRMAQIRKFFKAYNCAVDQLNGEKCRHEIVRNIFRGQYALPDEVIDSLKLPVFRHARMPLNKDIDVAAQWLQSRERPIGKIRRDSILCNSFIL